MAKQLYDYWFVQFDYPDAEGKPYKSSSGKMVWNEKLKREIPEGWDVVSVGDILDGYPTTKKYETKEYQPSGLYPIIDQGGQYIVGYTNEDSNLLNRLPAVLFGDHSTKVKLLDFPFARGADGTQILYSNTDRIQQYYLYHAVLSMQIPNPGYSRHFKYLKGMPIIKPDLDIAQKFDKTVTPIYKKWTALIHEINDLSKQRDELLPLLMTGQVSVTPLNNDLASHILLPYMFFTHKRLYLYGLNITHMKEPGYVYILTNPSFKEDWVKIGKSSRPVNVRSKELDNTAVPLPFEIFATIRTVKFNEVEKLIHKTIDRLQTCVSDRIVSSLISSRRLRWTFCGIFLRLLMMLSLSCIITISQLRKPLRYRTRNPTKEGLHSGLAWSISRSGRR